MEEKTYEPSKLSGPTWLRPHPASTSSSPFVNDVAARAAAAAAAAAAVSTQKQQEAAGAVARKWCGCDPGSQCVQCSFLHLPVSVTAGSSSSSAVAQAGVTNSSINGASRQGVGPPPAPPLAPPPSSTSASTNPWMSTPAAMMHAKLQQATELGALHQQHGVDTGKHATRVSGLVDLHSDTANSSDLVDGDATGGGQQQGAHHPRDHPQTTAADGGTGGSANGDGSQAAWQNARLKADITLHPFYEQLLAAHVACLRIATPVDQLPRIDAQLSEASQVASKYAVLGQNHLLVGEEKEELDQFMTHYVLLLYTFKEQLQHHVRVHAMEAVMACWELEQSLLGLTGVSPGEGTGATMSDDEDEPGDSDPSFYDVGFDAHDSGAFGPLIPTETERTLMERVRQELKNELKSGYKDRIVDVREEILRKRRAGKLPGDTTSVLKAWWQAHSKWPYPTEDEKARLVQETGLQLKQINNWFINQRKRNWHSNPSSAAALKNKRKRA